MAMGPGFYFNIGKQAKDLLYSGYQTDQKFSVTTCTLNGIAITAAGTKINELFLGELQSQLSNKNVTVDVKADSHSNLLGTVAVDELGTPGLRTILSFALPDKTSGKAELQYKHDYAGITAGIGLNAKPVINLSGLFGNKAFAVGADISYDTATLEWTKYNCGLKLINADLIASLTVNDKGDSVSASCYHLVSPLTSTAVGAELTHSFSSNENTITFGMEQAWDLATKMKARANSYGKVSGLIQHEWRPKSFVTMSAEVDTKAFDKNPKLGLAVSLKP